jgi:glutamate-ammonia-ligase adenylyltransferase
LVESILRSALAVVARHEGGKAPEAGWAVIALGRMGTIEMDLGSDLDVIFVASDSASHSAMRTTAERLIHVLSAYTREGTILPVDVRLRPHGGEGELIQTTKAVVEYFSRTAEVWEAATYLKARPVAGDSRVGEDGGRLAGRGRLLPMLAGRLKRAVLRLGDGETGAGRNAKATGGRKRQES